MNHRAENKLSYLEKLRSGRQRSPAGFEFSPLVPVSTPWLPTLHGSLGRSKVRLPLRSGRGHTSQQNDTLAFNLGAQSNKQGEARTQATCPLSVQGADSAPYPARNQFRPTDPERPEAPGSHAPLYWGLRLPHASGGRAMGPREANGSPSRLLPSARPPSTPTVPLEHPPNPEVRIASSPAAYGNTYTEPISPASAAVL